MAPRTFLASLGTVIGSRGMWIMIAFVLGTVATAAADPGTVTLKKGESLWQDASNPDFKNPIEWNGVQLFVIKTSRHVKGRLGGVVRAVAGGKSTEVAGWTVATTAPSYAMFHLRDGKAAFQFGTEMNLKSGDKGADTFIELVAKGGTVTRGKTWTGNRIATRPDWVKHIDPPL